MASLKLASKFIESALTGPHRLDDLITNVHKNLTTNNDSLSIGHIGLSGFIGEAAEFIVFYYVSMQFY
jgi:hypothetical protein